MQVMTNEELTIAVGGISETLNDKADLDLTNITANLDYVIETQLPTALNNYTWYRKYKSGWVEQGGKVSSATTSINYPIEMADTNYAITTTLITTRTSASYDRETYPNTLSTTGFTIQNIGGGSFNEFKYQVSGMSAGVYNVVFTPNKISCQNLDFVNTLMRIFPNVSMSLIKTGTMTYIESGAIWCMEIKDINGNSLGTYQQYIVDWEADGFTFTGSFEDGEVINFIR